MSARVRRYVLSGLMGLGLLATATTPAFVCDFERGWLGFRQVSGDFLFDDDDFDFDDFDIEIDD